MSYRQKSSPLTAIAIVLSLAIGGLLFYIMFKPQVPQGDPAVAQAVTPTPTPAPTASPAPTPVPAETVAAAKPPSTTHFALEGVVLTSGGEPAPDQSFFVTPLRSPRLRESLQLGMVPTGGYRVIQTDGTGRAKTELEADKVWVAGLIIDGQPSPAVQQISAAAGAEATAEFRLPVPFQVRGTVIDETFSRVTGATLVVQWTPRSALTESASNLERSVPVTADGRFSLELADPVKISIAVDKAALPANLLWDGKPVTVTDPAVISQRSLRTDLQLFFAVDVAGRVVTPGQAEGETLPVVAADLELTRVDGDTTGSALVPLAAKSDAEGAFAYPGLFPGEYLLTARAAGFAPYIQRQFEPALNGSPEIVLVPLPSISGRVAMPGEASADDSGQAFVLSRATGYRVELTRAADGTLAFHLPGLEVGPWLLGIEVKRGEETYYAERLVTLEAGQQMDELVMTPAPVAAISGRVLATAGEIIPAGAKVTAAPIGAPAGDFDSDAPEAAWRRVPAGVVAADGAFAISNVLGAVDYQVQIRDDATGRTVGSAEARGGQEKPISILVGGVGSIRGRVLSNRMEACDGLEILLTTGLGTVEGEAPDIQTRRTTTAFDGSYEFTNVPGGQARIYFPGDPDSGRLVRVDQGRATVVDMTCRTWVSIQFELVGTPAAPFLKGEQFLVVPQPGTLSLTKVRELKYGDLSVKMEPGSYTITRTSTMESLPFTVIPKLDGPMELEFKQ